jgi:flavin-dependent dehydrogenase
VGGGPAGAVAALVLAWRGVEVTVLEAGRWPLTPSPSPTRPPPARERGASTSNRSEISPSPGGWEGVWERGSGGEGLSGVALSCEAKPGECLPPSLSPLLQRLGLEEALRQDGHLRSYGNRFVWGSPEPGERPFLAGTRGDGWHIDRRLFEARLAEHAQRAGVDWRWGSRAARCIRDQGAWRLEVETGGERTVLVVDFVADASGRPARIARRLGARRLRYDRLVGVSALLTSPTPAADTYTLVEATPEGWWYTAVLSDGRMAAVFFSDGDLLPRSLLGPGNDPQLWWRMLEATAATRERVAGHGYRSHGALRVVPAESSRLDTIAGGVGEGWGEGWLALGDAYDPLSSHGIGSAMGSGFYGGQAIADLLAGREEARWAYLDLMQNAYGAYLDLQRRCYAQERRWPEAPFWRRRHAAGYCREPMESRGFR